MKLCKIILDGDEKPSCGKNICCQHCDELAGCKSACSAYEDYSPENCPEQVDETDRNDLQVIEKAVPNKIQEVTDLVIQMKKVEEKVAEIKEALLKAMEEHGIKKFENEDVSFTYVAETTSKSFDKAKLLKDHPEIKESDYTKTSKKKAYVKIQVK